VLSTMLFPEDLVDGFYLPFLKESGLTIYKNRLFYRVGGPYIPKVPELAAELGRAIVGMMGNIPEIEALPEEDRLNLAINWIYYQILYGELNYFPMPGFQPVHQDGYGFDKLRIVPGHFADLNGQYGPAYCGCLYVLGKAPSLDEIGARRNFVGDFGKALIQALSDAGVKERAYYANVSRIMASEDRKVVNFFVPFVFEELLILRPKAVLCLGNDALKVFTRSAARSVYSDEIEYNLPLHNNGVHTIKIFAAPLKALHNYADYQEFLSSINYLSRRLRGEVVRNEFTYDVISDVDTLRKVVDDILASSDGVVKVAMDAEWQGYVPGIGTNYVRTISFAASTEHAYVVRLTDTSGVSQIDRDAVAEQFNRFFKSDHVQVIGYNFMADMPWIESLGVSVWDKFFVPDDPSDEKYRNLDYPGIFDVIFAYFAIDEAGHFGLENAARVWLGAKPWSKELESFLKSYYKGSQVEGYGVVPDEILMPYTAADAIYTRKLYDVIAPRLSRDRFGNNCWTPYWRSMQAIPGFIEMFMTGVDVDIERYLALGNLYIEKLKEVEAKFRDLINWPTFNFRSYKQCVELLYGENVSGKRCRPEGAISFYITDIVKTTTSGNGNPSTDLETVEYLMASRPEIRHLRDLRVLDQLAKNIFPDPSNTDDEPTGIMKFIREDGRIHPSYSPLKETRRCSSSRPNMQNLSNSREDTYKEILGDAYLCPIRSIFVARPGHKIVSVDYTGAELLVLAVASRDKVFISDYYLSCLPDSDPNKLDIHSMIACLAFGLDCPPTKNGLQSIGKSALRLAAKRIIFGLNYGRSAASCHKQLQSQGVDISLDEVNRIVDTIYNRYSGVPVFQESVKSWVEQHRWLSNCFGSYRRFWYSNKRDVLEHIKREALNFVCQSAVADAVTIAMYEFCKYKDRERLGYRLILHNHDSLSLLVPNEHVDEVVNVVIPYCMQERVKIRSCDFTGRPYNDEEYEFGFSVSCSDTFSS